MFVPEKLKVNKLVQVDIPKPRDFFAQYGLHNASDAEYTGDNLASSPVNKVQELADIEAYDRMMQEKELKESR